MNFNLTLINRDKLSRVPNMNQKILTLEDNLKKLQYDSMCSKKELVAINNEIYLKKELLKNQQVKQKKTKCNLKSLGQIQSNESRTETARDSIQRI